MATLTEHARDDHFNASLVTVVVNTQAEEGSGRRKWPLKREAVATLTARAENDYFKLSLVIAMVSAKEEESKGSGHSRKRQRPP